MMAKKKSAKTKAAQTETAKRRPLRTVEELECLKCGRRWFPRGDWLPVRCPECRRITWDRRE